MSSFRVAAPILVPAVAGFVYADPPGEGDPAQIFKCRYVVGSGGGFCQPNPMCTNECPGVSSELQSFDQCELSITEGICTWQLVDETAQCKLCPGGGPTEP